MRKISQGEGGDRISELPQDLRQNILSYLPASDAMETSKLSTTWHNEWIALPNLELGENFREKLEADSKRGGDERKHIGDSLSYLEFIYHVLNTRKEQHHHTVLKTLRLYVPRLHSSTEKLTFRVMEQWLIYASQSGIEELYIDVNCLQNCYNFYLWDVVLAMDSLIKLEIIGINLLGMGHSGRPVRLPSLKKLSLKDLRVTLRLLQYILSNCPVIEELRLDRCEDLKTLVLSGLPTLQSVEAVENSSLREIEFDDLVSLRRFVHKSHDPKCPCRVTFSSSCANLVDLRVDVWNIEDCLFKKYLAQFVYLEHLQLTNCGLLSSITIASDHLRGLTVLECTRLHKVEIDCPNLSLFRHDMIDDKISLSPKTPIAPELYLLCWIRS